MQLNSTLQSLKSGLQPPWVPARYGMAPYFWLLSFSIFAWKYGYVAPSRRELLLLALTFGFFIPLYFYSFWAKNWHTFFCIMVSCIIGFLWAPYNYGSSSFLIFAASMCSRIPNNRTAYLSLGSIALVLVCATAVFKFETYFWVPALIFSIPSGVGAIMGERLTLSNENLLRKQEEIEHLAALAERERIGRDLHDLLGHTLSIITLKAELAGKLFERDAVACKKEISDIEHTARNALAEVRSAVLGYRATGLTHELQCAQNALDAAQVTLSIQFDHFLMPPAIENVIALTLREAMTNIIRHAKASRCEVSLFSESAHVCMRISDNGTAGTSDKSLHKGNGLNGMTERAQALGGELRLHAEHGLTVELRLPIGAIA